MKDETELKDLTIHALKELGEIAEVLVKKNRPDHWKNELGDLCGLCISPMLALAGMSFEDACKLGLERKYNKMHTTLIRKYQRKPMVVEVEQYVEYGKLVKGMCNSQSCFLDGNDKPHVHTIHANQIVNLEVGDFIIPEMDGKHYYPCKPDVFALTYEPI